MANTALFSIESSKTSVFAWPYLFLIWVAMIIPASGAHGFLNIKSQAIFLAVLGGGIFAYIKSNFSMTHLKILAFTCFIISFLVLWWIMGLIWGNAVVDSQWDVFKIFGVTIATVMVAFYLYSEKLLCYSTFIKSIIFSSFTFSIIKIGVIILYLFNLVDIKNVISFIGVYCMSMGITGSLVRVQFSTDIFTPFILFFVLNSKQLGFNLSKTFKFIYYVITPLSIFLSYSRYLFFVAGLSVLFYWLNQKLSKMVFSFVMFALITLGILLWIGNEHIENIIYKRFFSQNTSESDDIRVAQMRAFMRDYVEYPFLGKGLGGVPSTMIRDGSNPNLYEVQWGIFLLQFGLLGILFFLIPTGYIAHRILSFPITRLKLSILLLFLSWLLSGMTNPFLISLGSGVMYSLFLLTGMHVAVSERPQVAYDKYSLTI